MDSEAAPAAPPDAPSEHAEIAPPVVAVVVTSDSGPWLEDCLRSLAAQDYPNLSILVVDSGSRDDITARVAAVVPNAFVRRLAGNVGFGPAANEVLAMVQGASHFLFCHDDVAPAPDAVRLMVEEAYRSNAGIVAPKLVEWDRPDVLLSVGLPIDKSGTPAPAVEPGEIDQEQHDAVRDVFLAPGGCTLVRADLFATLGGFDPRILAFGEDLDLSWRTQIVGARVLVAPAARVRHRQAMTEGERRPPFESAVPESAAARRAHLAAYEYRHRLRTVLVCYSFFHLVRVIPQIVVLHLGELVYALATGRRRQAAAVVGAWRWNLGLVGDIRRTRKQVKRSRSLRDHDLRRLQVRGSARITAFFRSRLGPDADSRLWDASRRRLTASISAGRTGVVVWTLVGLVLVIGSRHLLFGRIPEIAELTAFPDNPATFLRQFVSGWRTSGLGSESPAPAAFALLGLAGVVVAGAMGTLQKILVLGMLPAGLVGIYRLARPLASPRARLVAVIVYGSVPLSYAALANGSWAGLIAYGATPWVCQRFFNATQLEPFSGPPRRPWPAALRLGILFALLGALAPAVPVMFVVIAALLALSGLLVGPARLAGAALLRALPGLLVGAALLFPWSLDLVAGGSWTGVFGVAREPATAPSLGDAIRFDIGPMGDAPVGWAFAAAAVLPLLVGRGWRLAWAGRLWVIALGSWLAVWAGGRGWLPFGVSPEVWLAPAAVALALGAALGLVAFQLDLPGYRFGWRQVASLGAAVAVAVGTLPVFAGAVDGRWDAGDRDFATVLSWMPDKRVERERPGDFRVLWVGDPVALPVGAWPLGDGLAYGTSWNGPPDATGRWAPSAPGTTGLVDDAIDLAGGLETTRLGHLIAPMSIRFVVVPREVAPGREKPRVRAPDALVAALSAQVDLELVDDSESLAVFENAAWVPARARLDDQQLEAAEGSGLASASTAELSAAPPVLRRERSPYRFQGDAGRDGGGVFHSESSGSGWQLTVDGERADQQRAFGWAMAYPDPGDGRGTLRYRTGPMRYGAIALQAGLWFAAVALVRRTRARVPGGVAP